MTQAQGIELARDFARDQFADQGMIADLNVDWDISEDGMPKPHAHVMLTMRSVDENGFGQKVRDWNRTEMVERWREHIAELNKRSAESELRLKRLYDAIEAGVADLDDPALKDRIDGLKAIRDQAKTDVDRAQAMLQNTGQKAVTPQMLRKFAATARERIRLEGGGYRRDHLRALAQRVEVAEGEVRIMGSKSRLLQTLVAGSGVNSVPTQGLKWRRGGV